MAVRQGAYGPGETYEVALAHETLDLSTVTAVELAVRHSDRSEATWVASVVGAPIAGPASAMTVRYVFAADGLDVPHLGPLHVTITLFVGATRYHGGCVHELVASC